MTIRRRVACWISKATSAQACASAPALTPTLRHTHTRARAHTRTHTYTRKHTRPNTQKYVIGYLLLLHCNNGFVNRPQCYVIRTLRVLFTLDKMSTNNSIVKLHYITYNLVLPSRRVFKHQLQRKCARGHGKIVARTLTFVTTSINTSKLS